MILKLPVFKPVISLHFLAFNFQQYFVIFTLKVLHIIFVCRATIRNYHKVAGLKQQKFILAVWEAKSLKGRYWQIGSYRLSKGKLILCLAPGVCPPSSALPGQAFLHTVSSFYSSVSSPFLSLTKTLPLDLQRTFAKKIHILSFQVDVYFGSSNLTHYKDIFENLFLRILNFMVLL